MFVKDILKKREYALKEQEIAGILGDLLIHICFFKIANRKKPFQCSQNDSFSLEYTLRDFTDFLNTSEDSVLDKKNAIIVTSINKIRYLINNNLNTLAKPEFQSIIKNHPLLHELHILCTKEYEKAEIEITSAV